MIKLAIALGLAAVSATAAMAYPPVTVPGGEYANSWDSDTRSRFQHVIAAPAGRARLTIRARTDSPGGETVAVYPQTVGGERGRVRIMFVIATRQGNSESTTVNIPRVAGDPTRGRLPIIVDVENASGVRAAGDYTIEVEPVE